MFEPAYLKLWRSGELERRAERAVAMLAECALCPRACHSDRERETGPVCNTGRHAVISSAFAHFGEEDCLRLRRGSGTIFFSFCNLRCEFCQNFEISWEGEGREVAAAGLAAIMLELQARGCHNINFVTPSHVVAHILEALPIAVAGGLRLPLVYNTGAYDSTAALELLDGVIDIYMPDFKFWDSQQAERFCKAPDYPEVARAAIKEMHRQVGTLQLDDDGIAQRGVLLRHLVMPNGVAGTRAIMQWVAGEVSADTFVNLMAQYHPAGNVRQGDFSDINCLISAADFRRALADARAAGLHRFDPGSLRRTSS